MRAFLFVLLPIAALAQAVSVEAVRPVPPPGVPVPDAIRAELTAGAKALADDLARLREDLRGQPELLAEVPSVEIFHKSVDWALRYDEFFDAKQFAVAREQLQQGHARAASLRKGEVPWNSATGLVVRAYRSEIDGSVQPYGLVIPPDWKAGDRTPRRLDFWCHGRNEKLSELAFLNDRQNKEGEFVPSGAFVLHLYGRCCVANKFAGERDLFEALADAEKHYPIDRTRLVVRGFSMGGAAAWQFGTHFPGMWAVVQPGAGFAETAEFFKVFAEGKTPPPWWEQVLWRWYDSTAYVANLANTTTVAYSGEIDGQKQAADIMIRAARKEAGNANPPAAEPGKVARGDGSPSIGEAQVTGTSPDVEFYHVIGLQTPHKIKPEAKPEIEAMIDDVLARKPSVPKKVRFTTYSLIYSQTDWLRIESLEEQWRRADVDAELRDEVIEIKTRNVASLVVDLDARVRTIKVDGQDVAVAQDRTKRGGITWQGIEVHKTQGQWLEGVPTFLHSTDFHLRKYPGVCGPIDHAFMSPFLFVKPTGKPLNDAVGAWTQKEFAHATGFWRQVFRGDAPVKDDKAITAEEIENSNLVLWGDPSSNAVLGNIIAKLPLKWDARTLEFRGYKLDAAHHAPVLIFPNPLNPQRYVVLNSGVTFREQALLNNSDQTPKLPDWAIIDLRTPRGPQWPGLVVDAGFFDEQWK